MEARSEKGWDADSWTRRSLLCSLQLEAISIKTRVEEEEAGKSRMLEEAKLRVEAAKEATVDKTKVIAIAAQDKVDGMKEHKTVAEDDAGKKLEAAKEELKEMKVDRPQSQFYLVPQPSWIG